MYVLKKQLLLCTRNDCALHVQEILFSSLCRMYSFVATVSWKEVDLSSYQSYLTAKNHMNIAQFV